MAQGYRKHKKKRRNILDITVFRTKKQKNFVFFDIIRLYRTGFALYDNRKIYSWIADGEPPVFNKAPGASLVCMPLSTSKMCFARMRLLF
jgi:hypothetical protein